MCVCVYVLCWLNETEYGGSCKGEEAVEDNIRSHCIACAGEHD